MNRKSKTKLLPSIAIFISGYTPLFLIMVIKDISQVNWYKFEFERELFIPYWVEFGNTGIVILLLLLSVFSLALLTFVLKNVTRNSFDINIKKAKSRSSEVVNYTIPYMISFVAFDLSKWQDILSLFLFLSVLCLLSIRSQSVFINPILAMLGYGLYDCKYNESGNEKECVMLSKHDLLAGESERYEKLNNYMGIISKKGT